MEIRVTKKQNVVVDGVKYRTVNMGGTACRGCAFDHFHSACNHSPCEEHARRDRREVIFIRKP